MVRSRVVSWRMALSLFTGIVLVHVALAAQGPCGYAECEPVSFKTGINRDVTFDMSIHPNASGGTVDPPN